MMYVTSNLNTFMQTGRPIMKRSVPLERKRKKKEEEKKKESSEAEAYRDFFT